MTASGTKTPTGPTFDSLHVNAEAIDDSSKIVSLEVLSKIFEAGRKVARDLAASVRRTQRLTDDLSDAAVNIGVNVLLSSGVPDFFGSSAAYREAFRAMFESAGVSDEERKAIVTSSTLRKAKARRTTMRRAMVDYLIGKATPAQVSALKSEPWTAASPQTGPALPAEYPDWLKSGIAALYVAADQAIPEDLGGEKKGRGANANAGPKVSFDPGPMAKGITDGKLSTDQASQNVVRILSALFTYVTAESAEKKIGKATPDLMNRAHLLALGIGQVASGKTLDPKVAANIAAALYDPEKDK